MQLMMEGGKWELSLPRKLGYGNHDAGSSISEDKVCVFDCKVHNNECKQSSKSLFLNVLLPFSLYLFFVYIKEGKDQLHWEHDDEELAHARGENWLGDQATLKFMYAPPLGLKAHKNAGNHKSKASRQRRRLATCLLLPHKRLEQWKQERDWLRIDLWLARNWQFLDTLTALLMPLFVFSINPLHLH